MSIIEYIFFQRALLGSILASVVCGIVGTYIVTRRLVFISGGITHASFGGIGIGLLLGINPILSATVFSIISACGVQYMSERGDVREDSSIAIVWTLGMSIGVICCFLTPGFMPDLPSYLFGNILTIGCGDLYLLSVLTLIVIILFAIMSRSLISISFDPVFARSQKLPVRMMEYGMMILIAVTIVAVLRIVGVVLAMGLLTIPHVTANLLTCNYRKMAVLSVIFGILYCMGGLVVSYWVGIPSGATIILVSAVIYLILKLFLKQIR